MVTRCGDMDPAVAMHIMKKENLNVAQIEEVLNKKSGVHGLSGLAPDFREIETASNNGDEKATISLENFKYSVASFIAKYAVAMNGIDTIIFTGGIGENQTKIREDICTKLSFMGVKIDSEINKTRGEEIKISKEDSSIEVYIIPTNEELMIAKDTVNLIK